MGKLCDPEVSSPKRHCGWAVPLSHTDLLVLWLEDVLIPSSWLLHPRATELGWPKSDRSRINALSIPTLLHHSVCLILERSNGEHITHLPLCAHTQSIREFCAPSNLQTNLVFIFINLCYLHKHNSLKWMVFGTILLKKKIRIWSYRISNPSYGFGKKNSSFSKKLINPNTL